MRSGSLKHKVEIHSYTELENDFSETVKSWVKLHDAYASILPLKATEKFVSKRTKSEVTHKVLLRYIPNINPNMRIVFGSRVFEIDSVLNIREENKILQIIATEEL